MTKVVCVLYDDPVSGWGFSLFPVFSGALILVLIAWLYNNAVRKTPYPQYW
jgi:CBS-domain-containing membrane protein